MDSLKEIDGFQSLSAGQQLLMLKNYNSVLFDKMNADTKKEANAEWTKKTTVGKLGRLGLSIVTLGTAKTFREKRKQKEVAGRLLAKGWLGFEDKQALLQSLVSVAEESPEVFVDREGDLQIEYVDSKRYDSNPDAYDIIKSYNEAASAYAAVPHSWIDNNISSNGEAENNNFFSKLLGQKHTFLSGKERSAMSDVKEEYNSARENFMNLMLETSGDTIENRRFAMKELNQLDERVKMNQIFTSDPNAENLLQESRDASVFNQAMSEFISKRGQYMAYGSLARIAAVATVTSIAAPVGLAIIGGMSYLRGKREVRDMLKMKRVSGAISEKDLNEEMVYTVDLHESLNNLNFAMEQAEANNDRDEGFRLRDRIAHVNKQIESGHNFEKRTRKLGEFRDAKFYSDRVENLISKYEMLKGVPGQERDSEVVELKIAQTATLMRELMNNNMLRFGGREDDSISPKNRKESKSVINRLAFIQALSLADTTISLDTNGIEKKVAEIVGKKRETINTVDENKAIKHCREAVAIGVVFGGVGYALTHFASGFFGHGAHHSGGGHVDSADKPTDGSLNLRARAPSIPKAEPQDIRGAGDGKSFIDSVKEGGENILEKIGIGNSHEALAEGMYRAHEGESLSSIIVSHNEKLLELSPNARDNAINNFLNHLTGSQLKEIGLTSPHKIVSGQTINIAKLEDYFDNMRVGGRTFAERAMQVTGEAPEKIQSIIEETPNNLSEVNPHQTYQELHRASLETIKARDAAAEAFINKATEVELKPLTYENTAQFESAFPSLTPAEVVASWDNIIPQYIAKHIGSNNYDLLASADNVKAGDLSGFMGHHANIIGGDPKSQMLKSVAEALEKHGITPDEGFDFNDAMVRNQNLKDFVEQSYRAMIMTSGIASIQ